MERQWCPDSWSTTNVDVAVYFVDVIGINDQLTLSKGDYFGNMNGLHPVI